MKFSCTRENLHQGLAITSRIGSKHVNLPILSNVLLSADGGGLKLISTNLEIAITCHIRGKVEQNGEYTIPSKLFFDYVNLLPNERIDIDLLDDAISVKCEKKKTKIKGITANDFPLVPPVTEGDKYSVSVSEFHKALGRVLFAAATNESRPELSGIYLSFNGEKEGEGKLVLASTDSYRLAEVVMSLSGGSKEKKDVIIPQRTLSELSRIISLFKDDVEAPPTIEVLTTENQVVFTYGSVELMSRVIEGRYPDYRQIIPENSKTQVKIDRSELIQAIKGASLFSKTGLFDIILKFDPNEGMVHVSAIDAARGENSTALAASVIGEENILTLNYRYILEGLNALQTSHVILKMIDGGSPCILLPDTDIPDDVYTYVIMPIRQ